MTDGGPRVEPADLAARRDSLHFRLQSLRIESAQAKALGQAAPLSIDLPGLYPEQAAIKAEARRFNVLCIGRRAGKTYLGTHLALEAAASGALVGWFAPTYKLLLEVWGELARRCRPHASKINATERRIELHNGGIIECWTMESDDPGRGRKYKLAIIDEAAIASNLKAVWEEAIRATLTDYQGSAWFLSTPKGLNYFHDLYQRGIGETSPEWRAWQMPSSVNPYLRAAEIESARADMPALAFQQEYEARFITSDGAVFRNVDACTQAGPTDPGAHARHMTVAGVDWGRQHDFTACSVVCVNCAREVALDRFNQIGWAFQRDRLLALFDKWGVKHSLIETNSIGSPNLEALRQYADEGIILQGFETTAKSKPEIIRGLALALERHTMDWLPDESARHELIAYQAETLPSDYTRYGAPEGGYDDTVIARALALRSFAAHWPIDLPASEKRELALPAGVRAWNVEPLTGDARELAELHRDYYGRKHDREAKRSSTWSNDVIDSGDNPWANIE